MATEKNLNDDFDLDGLDEVVAPEIPREESADTAAERQPAPRGAKAAPKKKAPKAKAAPKKKVAKKVWIMIDEVPGMSNFETIGHNGDIIQVKRGVAVEVEVRFMHVLELAVQTAITESADPVTGEKVETMNHFSAIPWRQVNAPPRQV